MWGEKWEGRNYNQLSQLNIDAIQARNLRAPEYSWDICLSEFFPAD